MSCKKCKITVSFSFSLELPMFWFRVLNLAFSVFLSDYFFITNSASLWDDKAPLGKFRVFFKQNTMYSQVQSREGRKFLRGSLLRGDSAASSWLRTHSSSLWTETEQDSLLVLPCRRRQLLTSCKGVTSTRPESSSSSGSVALPRSCCYKDTSLF